MYLKAKVVASFSCVSLWGGFEGKLKIGKLQIYPWLHPCFCMGEIMLYLAMSHSILEEIHEY